MNQGTLWTKPLKDKDLESEGSNYRWNDSLLKSCSRNYSTFSASLSSFKISNVGPYFMAPHASILHVVTWYVKCLEITMLMDEDS